MNLVKIPGKFKSNASQLALTFVMTLVLPSITARADGGDDDWKFETHQNLQLDTFGYVEDVGDDTNQFLETAHLYLPTTARWTNLWKLKLNPEIQADPLNNSSSERYWVELPEGFIQYRKDALTIQAGFNTFNWGVTDGYNPLDIVNSRRYQDPLRAEKLGAFSLSVKEDFTPGWSIEGLYIPWQRESILPAENSRWLPRQVLQTRSISNGVDYAELILPPDLQYSYGPEQKLDSALDNNFGIRMRGQISQLEIELAAFEGSSPTPATDVNVTGNVIQVLPIPIIQAEPQIGLTPVYYRQRVFGGSLVYAALDSIFRFEAAFTRLISQGADLPGNADEFVLGVEHGFAVGSETLTILLEGTYGNHSVPPDNSTGSLNRIFDRAVLLGGRYAFSEKATIFASVLEDTISHGQLYHGDFTYGLSDLIKLVLGFDVLLGDPNTPLGVYNENSRVVVGMSVSL
jgi:hypothetical protein